MSYLAKAIKKLKPEAEFSFNNEDYSTVVWDVLSGTAPTQKQLDDAITAIKAEEASAEADKIAAKNALLNRLGITAEEAVLLLS
jgi:hypothetical protein